jgi:single-strand DNA-binding protein
MKQITIAGNIGKSAETRTTQGGDKVTSWSVAVEERSGKEKSTIWFDCSLWGKRGESLAPYLTKGGKVAVSGDLGKREHEGKTYLTIRADQVTLMGGKPSQDDGEYMQALKPEIAAKLTRDIEDEIPF